MNRETLDVFFERGILALLLVILVFSPLAMGAVGTWEFLVVQGLGVAVLFLWGLRIIFAKKASFFWPPICWAVLAFALYAIARYFTADIEYIARFEMIQILLYAFVFFAIVNNFTSKESAQIISFTVIFLAAGISCYAIWQFMHHSDHVWNLISPYRGRATGTYISPNNFSCYLEMALPLSLAFLMTARIKPLTRILLGYAALAMAFALVFTFSRSGWVATAVGLLAVLVPLIFHRKHWLPALALLLALLAGGTFFVSKYLSKTLGYITRVESVTRSDSVNMEFRSEMWTAAEQMWQDHFWFGVGPAHYDYRFRQYRPETVQARPDRAHNDYLNLLADWGTTGGIIVAAGIVLFLASLAITWKVVRPGDHDPGRGMSDRFAFFLGASAALLALALHSFMDFNLHIPANAILGVCLLALLTGQSRMATNRFKIEARMPARILMLILLAVGMAYFSCQGCRRAQAYVWQSRAANPDLLILKRADLLRKAFAFEPSDFEITYQIAEFYRIQSFQGIQGYDLQAQTAMQWYSRGMKLDPFDGYNYLGYGMCLDWLERHDEAAPYFSRAEALDPNGYFTIAYLGWHYVQTGDYAAARACLQRSLWLQWNDNDIAHSYRDIVQDKLAQDASGQSRLPPGF